MYKKTLLSITIVSTLALGGCLKNGSEGINNNSALSPSTTPPSSAATAAATASKVTALFNPITSTMPIPNDLMFEQTSAAKKTVADGTLYAGTDPANPVITGIDQMDGNSVISQIDIKMSGSLDPAIATNAASSFIIVDSTGKQVSAITSSTDKVIPNPNQSIFVLPLTYPGGDDLLHAKLNLPDANGFVSPTDIEIPTFSEAVAYQTAVATSNVAELQKLATLSVRANVISLDGGTNNVLRLSPMTPLQPRTKYLVIVTNRVKTATGGGVQQDSHFSDLSNSNVPLLNPALKPVRGAVQGWEKLAAGYFGFINTVYKKASLPFKAPTTSDIALAYTFTTDGTDTVLKDIAAPNLFFQSVLTTGYKQGAIKKLAAGTYNLNGDTSKLTDPSDIAIDTGIKGQWTAQAATLSDPTATSFSQLTSATDQYIAEKIAADVAYAVYNSGVTAGGDNNSFTVAQEAAGTVATLMANGAPFPTPTARTTNFYNTRCMGSAATGCSNPVNPALIAPALLAEGGITLPYYLKTPDLTKVNADTNTATDGAVIRTTTWQANATIGAIIDAGKKALDPAYTGTTPPSSKVTYRYPFPTKQADVTIPIDVTYPNAAVIQNFGITKPANGWPVVIYQHGITTDRSAVLPMADALAFACINSTQTGPSGAPCYATVAIDQPLHGVVPSGSVVPGLISVSNGTTPAHNIGTPSSTLTERHFNFTVGADHVTAVPMVYNKTGGGTGSSGSLFVNLNNFANSRDALREAVVDLMNVNASLKCMDIDGDGVPAWNSATHTCTGKPDLDTSKVYFVGHSLGGIDGIPYVAVNNSADVRTAQATLNGILAANNMGSKEITPLNALTAAALFNTGGGVPKLLENSPSPYFGAPVILQGLAAASPNLQQGKSGLATYMNVLQGVFDSVDSMNFGADIKNGNSTGVLLTEIVGDGTSAHPSDRTIPNCADPSVDHSQKATKCQPLNETLSDGFQIHSLLAPLAGTEPLITQFGATKSATQNNTDGKLKLAVTRFTQGSHGTPVSAGNTTADTYSSAAVFGEMVSEMVSLFASNGKAIIVTNPAVVEK